jgi:hypothetical protein
VEADRDVRLVRQAAKCSLPLRRRGMSDGCMLLVHQFRTAQPASRQTVPNSLVLRIASKFGHDLAFGCKSQKPVRRVHVGSLKSCVR